MAAIECREIAKRYGVVQALKGVSCRVDAGEALCLFGPSGCGKTTLLRCMARLERVDGGHVRIGGEVVNDGRRLVPPRPGEAGMVFQDRALWPHLTCAKHLDLVLRGLRVTRKVRGVRVDALLDRCVLCEHRSALPGELSGGEQQRLAIARALAQEPRILLLDECFANLDAALVAHFIALFQERKEAGVTLVMATHHRDEADRLADRVFAMAASRGREGV